MTHLPLALDKQTHLIGMQRNQYTFTFHISNGSTSFGNSSRNEVSLGSEQFHSLPLDPSYLLSIILISLIPTEIRKPICITESLLILLSPQKITATKLFKDCNILPYSQSLKSLVYINLLIVKLVSFIHCFM